MCVERSNTRKSLGVTATFPLLKMGRASRSARDTPVICQARALALSIAAIRKARGKKNPDRLPDRLAGMDGGDEDFARAVLRPLKAVYAGPKMSSFHMREVHLREDRLDGLFHPELKVYEVTTPIKTGN